MFHASTKFLGVAVLIMLSALAFARPSGGAGTPAQKCWSAKDKAAGKEAACLAKAHAKEALGGGGNFTTCWTTFTNACAQAEQKAGAGVCPSEGDAPAIGVTGSPHAPSIDDLYNVIDTRLAGIRLADRGDGTVQDYQTGLQWEKKDTAVGSGVNVANPHDVDNTYTWTAGSGEADGTVFTDFLRKLNDCTSPDGTTITGGFAGHCDWRLPTITELQTIVDVTQGNCGGGSGACIDPVFGPTAAYFSWSSTSTVPGSAWLVVVDFGSVGSADKSVDVSVRAVRTGS